MLARLYDSKRTFTFSHTRILLLIRILLQSLGMSSSSSSSSSSSPPRLPATTRLEYNNSFVTCMLGIMLFAWFLTLFDLDLHFVKAINENFPNRKPITRSSYYLMFFVFAVAGSTTTALLTPQRDIPPTFSYYSTSAA